TANPKLNWAGKSFELSKSSYDLRPYVENLIVDLALTGNDDLKKAFEIEFNIRGSKSLNFLPLAKHTHIEVKGDWGNPSFNGGHLPENREVTAHSFAASWSIPSFARKLPQQWEGAQQFVYQFQGLELNN